MWRLLLVPQTELQRLSSSSDQSLPEQLLIPYDVQPQGVKQQYSDQIPEPPNQKQGSSSYSRQSVRFTPYPVSGGPGTRNSGAGSALRVREAKRYPVKRLSWFPTPETMSAARKGNLGHWTGKMEMMWGKRIHEITSLGGVPKNASGWADMTFGSVGKHLWRGSIAASALVVEQTGRGMGPNSS